MKKTTKISSAKKWVCCFYFLIGVICHSFGQNTYLSESLNDETRREWNISVFGGFSYLGPSRDIQNEMHSITTPGLFGNTNPNSGIFGPTTYPIINRYPIYDFECTYFHFNRSGFFVNAGVAEFADIRANSRVSLTSKLTSITFGYVIRSRNKRNYLFLGPSLLLHRVKDVHTYNDYPNSNNSLIGVYLAYSYHIVRTQYFILFTKVNFRWAPKSEVGPFDLRSDPNNSLYNYSASKVRVEVINIGLGMAICLGC